MEIEGDKKRCNISTTKWIYYWLHCKTIRLSSEDGDVDRHKDLIKENTMRSTNTNKSTASQPNQATELDIRVLAIIPLQNINAKRVLTARVQLRPHHSMHTWKQTQGPDAQYVVVSGVGSLTGLTNRSLLNPPAHRPSFHAHTQSDLSAGCLHHPGCQLHLSHQSSFIP